MIVMWGNIGYFKILLLLVGMDFFDSWVRDYIWVLIRMLNLVFGDRLVLRFFFFINEVEYSYILSWFNLIYFILMLKGFKTDFKS